MDVVDVTVEVDVEVAELLVVEVDVVLGIVVVEICGVNPDIDIATISATVIANVRPPEINILLFVLMV